MIGAIKERKYNNINESFEGIKNMKTIGPRIP